MTTSCGVQGGGEQGGVQHGAHGPQTLSGERVVDAGRGDAGSRVERGSASIIEISARGTMSRTHLELLSILSGVRQGGRLLLVCHCGPLRRIGFLEGFLAPTEACGVVGSTMPRRTLFPSGLARFRRRKIATCRFPLAVSPRSQPEPVAQELEGHVPFGCEGFRFDRSRPNHCRVPRTQGIGQGVERALHEHVRIRRSSTP